MKKGEGEGVLLLTSSSKTEALRPPSGTGIPALWPFDSHCLKLK